MSSIVVTQKQNRKSQSTHKLTEALKTDKNIEQDALNDAIHLMEARVKIGFKKGSPRLDLHSIQAKKHPDNIEARQNWLRRNSIAISDIESSYCESLNFDKIKQDLKEHLQASF